MIYVNLGMGLAELIEKRKSNPRLGRQPMDTDLVRHYDRQRHLELAIRRSDTYAYDRVRMNRTLFNSFCHLLITVGGLKRTRNVDIDEMVYTFLRTISHNEKNRTLILNLRRSGETISRSIHRVLRAVIRLNDMLMKKPVPIPENSTDSRWKYFKDNAGGPSREYNVWDSKHDEPFLQCLLELTEKGQISDGTCKNGAYKELERMMEAKVPGCGVKSKPTILNKFKKWKQKYHATVEMRLVSGWGWDPIRCHILADDKSFDDYVKVIVFIFFVYCIF
ncbi:unnamed protein product [Linum tenue]|uniref:Myb/SANT-like domain-containing protein n=1 Tax=Linum tenue TaxID=586396 RepID=A0AAV0KQR5_9ROSI|nr:unnamed protein product [Linum tenue]